MKTWIERGIFYGTLLAGIAMIAFGQSWFPEGSSPKPGDDDRRSLQKINQLMYNGFPSSPTNATVVSLQPAVAQITGSGSTLAEILNGSTDTFLIREVVIIADPDNTDQIALRKGIGAVYRTLYAGNEWVISAPAGCVFNANDVKVVPLSGTQNVSVFSMR